MQFGNSNLASKREGALRPLRRTDQRKGFNEPPSRGICIRVGDRSDFRVRPDGAAITREIASMRRRLLTRSTAQERCNLVDVGSSRCKTVHNIFDIVR